MKRIPVKKLLFEEKEKDTSITSYIHRLNYGDNIIRILPGDAVEIMQHFGVKNKWVCPKTDGLDCPMCSIRSRLWRQYGGRDNMPPNVQTFYDSLKKATSIYFPSIKYSDTEMRVGYLRVSKKLEEQLRAYIEGEDPIEFEKNGLKLNFKKKEPVSAGAFPTIVIVPVRDTGTIEIPDWKDQLPDLDILFPFPNIDDINAYLNTAIEEYEIDLQ